MAKKTKLQKGGDRFSQQMVPEPSKKKTYKSVNDQVKFRKEVKEFNKTQKGPRKSTKPNTDSVTQKLQTMQYGGKKKDGGIHINPANKGKFTATKKATGKTTEQLTHSKNPITKKRAIFAQNAKKWNKKK